MGEKVCMNFSLAAQGRFVRIGLIVNDRCRDKLMGASKNPALSKRNIDGAIALTGFYCYFG
jgi:hypothetical protein